MSINVRMPRPTPEEVRRVAALLEDKDHMKTARVWLKRHAMTLELMEQKHDARI